MSNRLKLLFPAGCSTACFCTFQFDTNENRLPFVLHGLIVSCKTKGTCIQLSNGLKR